MPYQLFNKTLQSPVIAGSSPLSLDAAAMLRLHRAGAGAVVTKNLCLPAKPNPYHYMRISDGDTLINCERALDYDSEQWLSKEMPEAAKNGVTVIANIGINRELTARVAGRLVDAGAAMVECVSYDADWLVDVVDETKKRSSLPILAKLSPNYKDIVAVAARCVDAGADGFTVGDSIGPIMRIDIETGRPFTGGVDGIGWMSGGALKPFAIRNVVEIRRRFDLPIIGMGGVSNSDDCIEMFMAGADFVGLCSALVTHGAELIGEMNEGIARYLSLHGHAGLQDIKAKVFDHLPKQDEERRMHIDVRENLCTFCGLCAQRCVYRAIAVDQAQKRLAFDASKCSGCGMCLNQCGALYECCK